MLASHRQFRHHFGTTSAPARSHRAPPAGRLALEIIAARSPRKNRARSPACVVRVYRYFALSCPHVGCCAEVGPLPANTFPAWTQTETADALPGGE